MIVDYCYSCFSSEYSFLQILLKLQTGGTEKNIYLWFQSNITKYAMKISPQLCRLIW
jgi:hypothetical protein